MNGRGTFPASGDTALCIWWYASCLATVRVFLGWKMSLRKKNTSQKYQLGRIFTNLWRLFVVELQESMLAHEVLSLVHFHTCYLVTCSHSCTYGNQGSVAFVQASMTCLRNRYWHTAVAEGCGLAGLRTSKRLKTGIHLFTKLPDFGESSGYKGMLLCERKLARFKE